MLRDVLRKFGSLVAGATGPTVRAAGRVWHLSPAGQALFGPSGPDLDGWLTSGAAEVVKNGAHRTVYRVRLGAEVVYVKHCRINGPRAWAREVLRPPKARLEFENAARLRALGIGAAEPLAWGTFDTRWPGHSFLITLELTGFVPLSDLGPCDRRALATELGAFIARLHEHGVAHPDPHPGNLLVAGRPAHPTGGPRACGGPTPPAPLPAGRGENSAREAAGAPGSERGSGGSVSPLPAGRGAGGVGPPHAPARSTEREEPRFALLDVHAICFGPPLSWAASRANLVLFNRWFQLRATRTERLRFWHAYRAARPSLANCGTREAKELEGLTAASNRRFWLARTARYAGTHRTVRAVRAGAVRGLAVRDLPDAFLQELLADPDALFAKPGTKLLKTCESSTVAEIELPTSDGPRTAILKRVNVRSALDPVKNLFRSSSVRRSWLLGHGLRERWLPTPLPLAVLHRYRCSLPAEGYLLTEKVPDAVGLTEAVRATRDPRLIRAWGERLARTVRAMHDRGVSHRDLKAPNVMLAGATTEPERATPVLIDLVGVSASADEVPFARRARELARLNASFLAFPHVTRTERFRFLKAYLAAPGRQEGWKMWWAAVSRATAAKVAKNRRSGRVLG